MAEKDPHQTNNTCSAEDINPILCAECGIPMYSEKINDLGNYTIGAYCQKCGYTVIMTGSDKNHLKKSCEFTKSTFEAVGEILSVGTKCLNPNCDGITEVKTRKIHYGATRAVNSSLVLQCTKCCSVFEFEHDLFKKAGIKTLEELLLEEISNENNLSH